MELFGFFEDRTFQAKDGEKTVRQFVVENFWIRRIKTREAID